MAVPNNRETVLMVLETLQRDIHDGKVTVENLCLSAESEITDVKDGWAVHSYTGRRILTIIYEVPRKAAEPK